MQANLVFPLVFLLLAGVGPTTSEDDLEGRDLLFKDLPEIMALRGYKTKQHFITTKDGYILSLMKCINPLIGRKKRKHKTVLLFVHGTTTCSEYFVVASANARPQDYSKYNVSSMSEDEIYNLVADDPARENLPMLALNFGHEVWFMDRRGSARSRRRADGRDPKKEKVFGGTGKLNSLVKFALSQLEKNQAMPWNIIGTLIIKSLGMVSSMVNSDYWEFSFDEQAEHDLPQAIDYILGRTGRKKLALLGHSAGSTVVLMSLAKLPEIAEKVSQAHIWAPAADLGHSLEEKLKMFLGPLLVPYIGPVPPLVAEPIIKRALASLCGSSLPVSRGVCKELLDSIFGYSGPEVQYQLGLLTSWPAVVSARELAHLSQMLSKNETCHFDYGNLIENKMHYGTISPPVYDFSAIPLKMYIVVGLEDGLAGHEDTSSIVSKLSIEPEVKIINDPATWNHVGFFTHSNKSRIVMIPTLKQLASIELEA